MPWMSGPMDFSMFQNRTGFWRIAIFLLGLVDLTLTGRNYSPDRSIENCFLVLVIVLFTLTFVYTLFVLIEIIDWSNINVQTSDKAFNILGGFILIIGGSFWLSSVVRHAKANSGQGVENINEKTFIERMLAGTIGILNGYLYLIVGYGLWMESIPRPRPQIKVEVESEVSGPSIPV